ncbi:MAG: glycosyltransferase [Bacteroidaceae bacterium]|nr:glycosyltransferase [Bacteroidaceae bacterium]
MIPTPEISVIVPVYNAEAYIHRCINSLLAQTFDDFEVILVDDGSLDGSGAICDDYARKNNRVRVFHKENGGVASARQLGVDKARGEYTIHTDPDDWVEPTMLEELYYRAKTEKADMVICDFLVEENEGSIYRVQQPTNNSADVVLEELLLYRLHGSLCNKLIRRECYTLYNIAFVKGLNYCEDYLVCVKLLQKGIKVAYLNKAFYHYDQIVNSGSITRNFSTALFELRKMFISRLQEVVPDRKELIVLNKLDLKYALFEANMPKVFKTLYPEVDKDVWKLNKSMINRILLYVATNGLFKFAHILFELKNSVRRLV